MIAGRRHEIGLAGSWTALVIAAAVLAGCASREQRPAPPRPSQSIPVPPAAAAPAAAGYVSAAGSADLFVVRASELALQRLGPGAERTLADMLLRDHRGMSAQLSLSGRRVNLLPSATLLPRHQARLSALQASGDLAAEYRRQMIRVHEELSSLHTNFAARGSSPTLRPVAAAAAETIRRHLNDIR